MKQKIAHITLLVKEYDEAIKFYTEKLDFTLLEDTKINEEKRWVTIAPPGAKETSLVLTKSENKEQLKSVGNQAGGSVFLLLFTDNFWRDYTKMVERNIVFVKPPAEYEYGKVAIFKDLYGNQWDLLEPTKKNKSN